jgi:hypothetical protein
MNTIPCIKNKVRIARKNWHAAGLKALVVDAGNSVHAKISFRLGF